MAARVERREAPTPSLAADDERHEATTQTCSRLFPNQDVMQAVCRSSCAAHPSVDGRDCAFAFSRNLGDAPPQHGAAHGAVWVTSVLLIACMAVYVLVHLRRRTREPGPPATD